MSELRTIGRHTLVYGAGIVASKLVSFIMLPVYTHYLTTADYGVLELLGTTIDVIGMIGGIGLAAGVFKHYAEADSDDKRQKLMSTVTLGSGALSLLIALIGIAASPMLTRMLFGPDMTPDYFRMFFLIYFFQNLSNLGLAYVQVEEKSGMFVALNVLKLILQLSLTIYFVVVLKWSIRGVLVASVISSGLFGLGMAAYTLKRVGVHFANDVFRRLSRFGAPVAAWTIGSFILTFSDRYFLNHYSGPGEVGIYSLAYKFSFLLSTFAVAPFSQIWEPRRFAIAKEPNAGIVYRQMFNYMNVALFFGSIGIVLFIRDTLTVVVDPAFVSAYRIVPLLLVTTILQQWTGYCNFGLFLRNATHLYAWSALIGVVTALVLNTLLIPHYGMFGAAWATVIAYAVRFIPVYLFAQSKYRVDYSWSKVAELALVLGGVMVFRYFADGLRLGMSLLASTVVLLMATALIYTRMLDNGERAFLRQIIRRPFASRTVVTVQDVT